MCAIFIHVQTEVGRGKTGLQYSNNNYVLKYNIRWYSKKNQNAPTSSEHPPVRGEKCQNV